MTPITPSEAASSYSCPAICELMRDIRDMVNEPRQRDIVMSNARAWNMLCSAMDAIEDTDLAIEAYLQIVQNHETDTDSYALGKGYAYLLCSGAMQTLYAQEDAVITLCKCLDVVYDKDSYPELKEVRSIRNATVGHPVNWEWGKKSTKIIQHSLNAAGFEMFVFSDGHEFETSYVSVPKLVSDQRKCLEAVLQKVIDEMRDRERKHREKFRDVKLAAILNSNMLYFFEKICEATYCRDCVVTGIAALETLAEHLSKVEQALNARGIELKTYDVIEHYYDMLAYPIDKLRAYYRSIEDRRQPEFDDRTAYIFAFFICEHFRKLEAILQEIDEEYASEV